MSEQQAPYGKKEIDLDYFKETSFDSLIRTIVKQQTEHQYSRGIFKAIEILNKKKDELMVSETKNDPLSTISVESWSNVKVITDLINELYELIK